MLMAERPEADARGWIDVLQPIQESPLRVCDGRTDERDAQRKRENRLGRIEGRFDLLQGMGSTEVVLFSVSPVPLFRELLSRDRSGSR